MNYAEIEMSRNLACICLSVFVTSSPPPAPPASWQWHRAENDSSDAHLNTSTSKAGKSGASQTQKTWVSGRAAADVDDENSVLKKDVRVDTLESQYLHCFYEKDTQINSTAHITDGNFHLDTRPHWPTGLPGKAKTELKQQRRDETKAQNEANHTKAATHVSHLKWAKC